MFMRMILPVVAAILVFPAWGAEDRRVLVFDSGTKPSVAVQNPRYEWRHSDSQKTELLCDACFRKKHPDAGTKPSVAAAKRGEAYLCAACGKFVWRDQGKEVCFTDAGECKACEAIQKALAVPRMEQPSSETSGQSKMHRPSGTKPTARQNVEPGKYR